MTYTPPRPLKLILLVAASCTALAAVAFLLNAPAAVWFGLFTCVGIGLLLLLYAAVVHATDRATAEFDRQHVNTIRQMQALLYVYSVIEPRHPLPPLSSMAISPDLAAVLANLIFELRPRMVLELGSGCSTLIAGYCLERVGSGRIVSLDHEERYTEQTRRHIAQHQLESVATVIDAPLQRIELPRGRWSWYGLEDLPDLPPIDLLVIDGPPEWTGPLARYPALPQLKDRLSRDAVIVLDDTARPDEQEAVRLWLEEFPEYYREDLPCEKGAIVLRRAPVGTDHASKPRR